MTLSKNFVVKPGDKKDDSLIDIEWVHWTQKNFCFVLFNVCLFVLTMRNFEPCYMKRELKSRKREIKDFEEKKLSGMMRCQERMQG